MWIWSWKYKLGYIIIIKGGGAGPTIQWSRLRTLRPFASTPRNDAMFVVVGGGGSDG